MKLLEHEAKDLFRAAGIKVPATGGVITDLKQLPAALRKAGKALPTRFFQNPLYPSCFPLVRSFLRLTW